MINQYGFNLGIVGMDNVDTKDFFSVGDAALTDTNDIKSMDLSDSPDKDVSKKTRHNFKRVFKQSPARSIVAASAVTILVSGAMFYALGDGATESKAGRDLQGLDTVSFDYAATGRDQLTQEQVDHIQNQGESRAREAATNSESYTPTFADVVTATVTESSTDELSPTQVSFEGNVSGSSYVDPSAVKNTSLATSVDYGPAPVSSGGAINYGSATTGMPPPAATTSMQQGAGSPNATYQTNDNSGGGNYDTGGGGDGGMGAGGPNATGIDPSVEALRQSLEDDYNQQQQMDQQYRAEQIERQQQQQQYIQQETQQRQQASAQAVQQQQQGFLQNPQSNMGFTASTYIPKQPKTYAAEGVWNNDITAVSSAAAINGPKQGEEAEEVKNLAGHIVRVGTTWNVVVENEVNTDNGTTVFARALSGPYTGSRLIGTINSTGLANRSAGVIFETLIPERRNKNAIPIKAVGMTLGDLNTHVATSVNRHYLQRYSALIAQGITGGYGAAYADNTGVTSQVINPDGSVTTISNKSKPDSEEIRGQVLGQLGTELQGEFGAIRARPTTFTIEQGTPLTIMFVENMDNKTAKTDSIKVGQGSFSNTSSYGMQPRTLN